MGDFADHQRRRMLEEEEPKRGRVRVDDDKRALEKELSIFSAHGYGFNSRLSNAAYLNSLNSKNPQAVFKIIGGAIGKQRVTNLFQYISRDAEYMTEQESVPLHDERGQELSTKADRNRILSEWASEFTSTEEFKGQYWKVEKLNELESARERLQYHQETRSLNDDEQKRLKELNRQITSKSIVEIDAEGKEKKISLKLHGKDDAVHMIFSVGGQDHNIRNAEEAMRRTVSAVFTENGHKAVWATHNDTNNLHFHVILKARNEINGKLVNFGKDDLFAIRQEFAHQLTQQGIQRMATLRRDRPKLLQKVVDGTERLYERQKRYEDNPKMPHNVFIKKRSMLKAIETLQKQSNEAAVDNAFNSENVQVLNAQDKLLADMKKQLKRAPTEQELINTAKYLKAQDRKLAKNFDETASKFEKAETREQRDILRRRRESQAKVIKKHYADIKDAKDTLKRIRNKDNTKSVDAALSVVNQLSKQAGKSK